MKQFTQTTLALAEPKYKIGELIRKHYGELKVKQGLDELKAYCRISRKQTIVDWLSIEAGDEKKINNLVIDKVLSFFNLQNESQLYTTAHKQIINDKQ